MRDIGDWKVREVSRLRHENVPVARKVYKIHASGVILFLSTMANVGLATILALTFTVKKFEYHFFMRPYVEAERNRITMELNNAMDQFESYKVRCESALKERTKWKHKRKGGTKVSPSSG